MSRRTLPVSIARIACCADDSTDRGSCRLRLPASILTAAGIPYHKPVIVSINCEGSSHPWRLLCVASLAPEEEAFFYPQTYHHHHQHVHLPPSSLTPSPPQHPPPTPPAQTTTPPSALTVSGNRKTKQPSPSPLRAPIVAPFAVLDATVILPPPGCNPDQLPKMLAASATRKGAKMESLAALSAEVVACRGPQGVMAAVEVRLRCPPGQQHLATPRMSFKLHQALVLPGCFLAISPSCYVEIISVQPETQYPDQPLRIVPTTSLTVVGLFGEPDPPLQHPQNQYLQQHMEGDGAQKCSEKQDSVAVEQGQTGKSAEQPAVGTPTCPGGRSSSVGATSGDGVAASTKRGTSRRGTSDGFPLGLVKESELHSDVGAVAMDRRIRERDWAGIGAGDVEREVGSAANPTAGTAAVAAVVDAGRGRGRVGGGGAGAGGGRRGGGEAAAGREEEPAASSAGQVKPKFKSKVGKALKSGGGSKESGGRMLSVSLFDALRGLADDE